MESDKEDLKYLLDILKFPENDITDRMVDYQLCVLSETIDTYRFVSGEQSMRRAIHQKEFVNILLYQRINQLIEEIKNSKE